MRPIHGGFRRSAPLRPETASGTRAGISAKDSAPHETYVGVQVLRGVAALLVVVFHCGLMVRDRFPEIGTALVEGMIYQFRVFSSDGEYQLSSTEDLRGVFQYAP